MRWQKLLASALFLCDRRRMTTLDGSIPQQRRARQQVQEMSQGRTKREGGWEWERKRKQHKNKGQRVVMIGGGGRENPSNSEQLLTRRHVPSMRVHVETSKSFRSNARYITWAQAYWHTIHFPALKKTPKISEVWCSRRWNSQVKITIKAYCMSMLLKGSSDENFTLQVVWT